MDDIEIFGEGRNFLTNQGFEGMRMNKKKRIMWIEIMELFENGDVNDIERYFFFFFFLFPICDVNNHIGISLKRGLAILNLKELVSKD